MSTIRQGRMCSNEDRNKNIIEYFYNRDNNIVRKAAHKDTEGLSREEKLKENGRRIVEQYSYNSDGTLKYGVNKNSAYSYSYTPDMQLKSKSINGKNALSYEYDKDSNIIQITSISGKRVNYKYDILGRIQQVLEEGKESALYHYNNNSTISEVKLGNGINIKYNYDEDKNISRISAVNRTGLSILNHNYVYDNNGSQTERNENGSLTRYFYDKVNRLEKAEYPDYTEIFTYDKAGNRIQRQAQSIITDYSYDKRNRLVRTEERTEVNAEKGLVQNEVKSLYNESEILNSKQTDDIASANTIKVTKFSYDNNGNLLSQEGKDGVSSFRYDSFNRTCCVEKADGSYLKNYYDTEGLRSRINENGTISNFVFDRGSIISESDDNYNVKAEYIRGYSLISQTNNFVPQADSSESYYYLSNCHDDIINITDSTGNSINSYRYDVFGNTVEAEEKISNRFRYAGEQYDPVTTQYYLRARFYNPVVGRFTQEDVYRGDGLNLYAYVGNNPVNYVDPSGYVCKRKAELYKKIRKENPDMTASDAKKAVDEYVKEHPYGDGEVGEAAPEIGTKLQYIFGKATGSTHNIERSLDMERQLNRIGIFDNAEGRAYVQQQLEKSFYDTTNEIVQSNGRVMKEALLSGPNGVLKIQSIWDGNRLITMELFGGGN